MSQIVHRTWPWTANLAHPKILAWRPLCATHMHSIMLLRILPQKKTKANDFKSNLHLCFCLTSGFAVIYCLVAQVLLRRCCTLALNEIHQQQQQRPVNELPVTYKHVIICLPIYRM